MIDPAVLATLPAEEVRCGVAEMIKHGIIGDPDLFVELETIADYGLKIEDYKLQIARALRVKIDIVEGDPFEEGARALLNLGHTVGHALERLSGFKLRHGEAVSIGMVAEARIAVELGRADRTLAERIETVLAAWGCRSVLRLSLPPPSGRRWRTIRSGAAAHCASPSRMLSAQWRSLMMFRLKS